MANYDIIGGIVSPEALKELNSMKAIVLEITDAMKKANLTSLVSPREIAQYDNLIKKNEKLELQLQTMRANQEKRAQKVAEQANKEIGYMNLLEKEVKELTQAYAMLSKAELEGTSGNQVLANLKAKREELAALKAGYGDMRMNVGNYASATKMLGINIGMVMKEMPNFAISMRTGIMALTNNIPMLAESFKAVRDQQKMMIAEGQRAPSMFSLISKSIFGLTGIVSILMVVIQAFSPQITKFFEEIFKGKDKVDKTAESLKQMYKAMSDYQGQAASKIGDIIKLGAELKKYGDDSEYAKTLINKFNTTFKTHYKTINDIKDAYPKLAEAAIDAAYKMQASVKLIEMGVRGQMMVDEAQLKLSQKKKEDTEKQLEMYRKLKHEFSVLGKDMGKFTEDLIAGKTPYKSFLGQNVFSSAKGQSEELARFYEKGINLWYAQQYAIMEKGKGLLKLAKKDLDNVLTEPIQETEIQKKLEEEKDAKESIYDFDILLYKAMQDNLRRYIKEADKAFEDQKKKFDEFQKDLRNATNISGATEDWTETESEEFEKLYEKYVDAREELKELNKDNALQTVTDLINIWTVFYDWQSKKIDENLEKQTKINDEKIKQYEDETEAGIHTQEELSDYKDRIAAYQASQEEEADRKKKEMERKSFISGQLIAIAEIWFEYSKANQAIIAAAASMSALNPALAATYLATAKAINLTQAITGTTLAAAQTIPYFEHGGIMEETGFAMVGEKRHELGINPDGSFFITPDRPTIMQLQKGTQILPDANKFDLDSIIALKQIGISQNDKNTPILKEIARSIKSQKQGNFYGMPLIKQLQRSEHIANRRKSLMN